MISDSSGPAGDSIANPYDLLRRKGICQILGVDQRTLSRWISAGDFPEPDVKRGARFLRWRRATVDEWIARKGGAASRH